MRELSEAERGRAELLFVAATAIATEIESFRVRDGGLVIPNQRHQQLQDLARKVTDAAFDMLNDSEVPLPPEPGPAIVGRYAPADYAPAECPCLTCTRARNA